MDSDTGAPLFSYVDGDVWVCIFCTWRNQLARTVCEHCKLSREGGRLVEPSTAVRRLRPALSRTRGPGAEGVIALGLFAAYRLGDIASGRRDAGAVGRGRQLWNLERTLRLPSEHTLQQALLPHVSTLHALDLYYAAAHLGGMALAAGWLYRRHRPSYGRWRNAVVLTTAACFALQLVTVAPPRLVPGLGLEDTATRLHESVYSHAGLANQVSSFPSVHMAWAAIVAVLVVTVSRSRRRVLVLLHPLLTLVAIVATANHYWLDAAAALVVAGVAVLATRPAR